MPSEINVFKIVAGPLDILLPAGDFFSALASSSYKLKNSPDGTMLLEFGKQECPCFRMEDFFAFIAGGSIEARTESFEAAAFLHRASDSALSAFIVERNFELVNYPVRSFKLLPASLKSHLSRIGINAMRFTDGGGIQLVCNVSQWSKLAPSLYGENR